MKYLRHTYAKIVFIVFLNSEFRQPSCVLPGYFSRKVNAPGPLEVSIVQRQKPHRLGNLGKYKGEIRLERLRADAVMIVWKFNQERFLGKKD